MLDVTFMQTLWIGALRRLRLIKIRAAPLQQYLLRATRQNLFISSPNQQRPGESAAPRRSDSRQRKIKLMPAGAQMNFQRSQVALY
jgi:hypothetical protein